MWSPLPGPLLLSPAPQEKEKPSPFQRDEEERVTVEKGECIKADHRLGGLIGVFVSILSSSSLEKSLNPNHTSFLGHFQTNYTSFLLRVLVEPLPAKPRCRGRCLAWGELHSGKVLSSEPQGLSFLVARSFFCHRPIRWVFSACFLTHEIPGSNRMGLTSGSTPGVIWGHLAMSRDNSDCHNFDLVLLGHCG